MIMQNANLCACPKKPTIADHCETKNDHIYNKQNKTQTVIKSMYDSCKFEQTVFGVSCSFKMIFI